RVQPRPRCRSTGIDLPRPRPLADPARPPHRGARPDRQPRPILATTPPTQLALALRLEEPVRRHRHRPNDDLTSSFLSLRSGTESTTRPKPPRLTLETHSAHRG